MSELKPLHRSLCLRRKGAVFNATMPPLCRKEAILSQSVWVCLFLLLFWVSALISWQFLSKVDFFYSFWYRVIAIGSHIDHYAPQNYSKQGFELTSTAERSALFAEIVKAINDDGAGLASIAYKREGFQESLLTRAEVLHLIDVASLIGFFKRSSLFALMVLVLAMISALKCKLSPPPLLRMLAYLLISLLLTTSVVMLIGPERIFYGWHRLIFPVDHQWFFFYQESLMSTMMKAPELFAYIGICWFFLALFLALLGYGLLMQAHHFFSEENNQ